MIQLNHGDNDQVMSYLHSSPALTHSGAADKFVLRYEIIRVTKNRP